VSVPTMFFARATPLAATSTAAITATNSSAVFLTVFSPSFGRDSSIFRSHHFLQKMQHASSPAQARQPSREADGIL
jgi:hypothetical protein